MTSTRVPQTWESGHLGTARRHARKGRDAAILARERIKAALDSNERPMHCHHEKLVVIDAEVAIVGGIDHRPRR
jgi:hypothetical protein